MRTDCHQHVWPPAFVEALRARRTHPYVVGDHLHLPGEAPYPLPAALLDVEGRRAQELAEGEAALVSLSSPLGIEHLPGPEGAALLEAWHTGALALGEPFGVWAAACVVDVDDAAARALAALLAHERVVGLQLPATALGTPAALARLAPLLEACEAADAPLLVHPGPAPAPLPDDGDGDGADLPPWWPALVPYVAQLHAAWAAWHVAGRARHPRLRVGFVALAGLAPLHHERLAARGGRLGAIDPLVHYETSSYGARAIDAMVRVVGVDPLVHGSDRPYAQPVDPGLGAAFTHGLFTANPRHYLTGAAR